MEQSILAETIAAGLRVEAEKKNSFSGSIGLFIVTMLFFFSSGMISYDVTHVLVLIAVLFIHEAGHFALMKMFRYSDVKMFFIPFIGAAVKGSYSKTSQIRKAFISLAGPVPGVILAIAAARTLDIYDPLVYKFISVLLFLNVFNLLPLSPLDGGRFFESLFGSNRYFHFLINAGGIVSLIAISILSKSWVLMILLMVNLMSVFNVFKLDKISREILIEFGDGGFNADDVPFDGNSQVFLALIEKMKKTFGKLFEPELKTAVICSHIIYISDGIKVARSAMWKRLLMVPAYSGILVFSVFLSLGLSMLKPEMLVFRNGEEIIMQKKSGDQLQSQYHLNAEGLIDGEAVHYFYDNNVQKILRSFTCVNGLVEGTVKSWDTVNKREEVFLFSNGKLISKNYFEDGKEMTVDYSGLDGEDVKFIKNMDRYRKKSFIRYLKD